MVFFLQNQINQQTKRTFYMYKRLFIKCNLVRLWLQLCVLPLVSMAAPVWPAGAIIIHTVPVILHTQAIVVKLVSSLFAILSAYSETSVIITFNYIINDWFFFYRVQASHTKKLQFVISFTLKYCFILLHKRHVKY